MAKTPVRTSVGSLGASGDGATTYPDTTSGYGATRADSRGVKPDYPYAYKAQAAKAYQRFQQPNKGKRNGA